MADFVFHDPTGRRARRANLSVGLVIALAALMVAGFFATLAFAPRLPDLTLKDPQVLQALHVETAHRLKRTGDWRRIPRPNKAAPGGRDSPLSVGFYVSWDETSRVSLKRHVGDLDVVSRPMDPPRWVPGSGCGHLGPAGGSHHRRRPEPTLDPADGAQRAQRHFGRTLWPITC